MELGNYVLSNKEETRFTACIWNEILSPCRGPIVLEMCILG